MRLLILSSKTGGGHEMRAQAIVEFCRVLNIKSHIIRPLEEGSQVYFFGTNIYNWIQRFYPKLHSIYFNLLERASIHASSNFILGQKKFQQRVKSFAPNAVISVHAHLNHGFWDLIKELYPKSPPKFMIYCGELDDGVGFSRHWINPKADLFCGPSEKTILAAIKRGMPASRCSVLGPLLRQSFYGENDLTKNASFFNQNFFIQSLPIGLLATGANGVNSHEMALRGVARSKIKYQIAVLCGRSNRLLEKIKLVSKTYSFPIIPFSYLEAEDMSALLNLSSWVFGRPGAGLTTEAIATGTEIIFDVTKGVMPQEQNNLNYFKNHGLKLRLAKNTKTFSQHIIKHIEPSCYKLKNNPEFIRETISGLVGK